MVHHNPSACCVKQCKHSSWGRCLPAHCRARESQVYHTLFFRRSSETTLPTRNPWLCFPATNLGSIVTRLHLHTLDTHKWCTDVINLARTPSPLVRHGEDITRLSHVKSWFEMCTFLSLLVVTEASRNLCLVLASHHDFLGWKLHSRQCSSWWTNCSLLKSSLPFWSPLDLGHHHHILTLCHHQRSRSLIKTKQLSIRFDFYWFHRYI